MIFRYRQAQHKASAEDMAVIDELLSTLDIGSVLGVSEDEQSLAATQAYPEKGSRKLKREFSDVSLDEDGLPLCLGSSSTVDVKTPVKAKPVSPPEVKSCSTVQWSKKAKVQEARFLLFDGGHSLDFLSKLNEDLVCEDEGEGEIEQQVVETPPKATAKAKTKVAPKAKSQASQHDIPDGTKRGETEALGAVKLVTAASQTYVLHQLPGEKKWPLVVAVSQTQSEDHLNVGTELFRAILSHNLDKAGAVAKRQELLNK